MDKKWYKTILKIADIYNEIINFLCVVLLTAQTLAILLMVFGRYILNSVPQWTEQFALFCMIWFAMLSICLGVRNDSHVKMEVIDTIVSTKALMWVKLFAHLCTCIFGVVMVVYGIEMCELTWNVKLSAFRISTGIQYASAVVGGFFMVTNSIVCALEMIIEKKGLGGPREVSEI